MRSSTQIAESFYRAFADRDRHELMSLLSPTFVGHVSAGMPGNTGGTHVGPVAMLAEVWLPTLAAYEVTPVPDGMRIADDGSLVVHGYYTGRSRASGREVRAEFVHLIEFDADKITMLRQVTDTASWPIP